MAPQFPQATARLVYWTLTPVESAFFATAAFGTIAHLGAWLVIAILPRQVDAILEDPSAEGSSSLLRRVVRWLLRFPPPHPCDRRCRIGPRRPSIPTLPMPCHT